MAFLSYSFRTIFFPFKVDTFEASLAFRTYARVEVGRARPNEGDATYQDIHESIAGWRQSRFCATHKVKNNLLLNGPSPTSFRLFSSFQTNITILQQINVKKYPSSIRCWESNPRPSELESPPRATRAGLPPNEIILYALVNLHHGSL